MVLDDPDDAALRIFEPGALDTDLGADANAGMAGYYGMLVDKPARKVISALTDEGERLLRESEPSGRFVGCNGEPFLHGRSLMSSETRVRGSFTTR